MATANQDHLVALQNRLLNIKRQKESEVREIEEMLRVLRDGSRLIESTPLDLGKIEGVKEEKGRKLQNRNVTQLVREYIESFKSDEAIELATLIKWLQERGVKGKYRSLYSSIHVILKKEQAKGIVQHMKGVGFFKPAKKDDNEKEQQRAG